jgi:5-(carboxyamino)imidazole ribonucleotide synthase
MVNILGDLWNPDPPAWDRVLEIPGARLHLYGKTEPRPGRKMGHVTCVAPSPAVAIELAAAVRRILHIA